MLSFGKEAIRDSENGINVMETKALWKRNMIK